MTYLNYFAARLKELREKAGLSQYGLAKKAGLTKQALSRLELGERGPVWETVQRLALALGADCRAFSDPDMTLPDEEPAKPRGRPRKSPPADTSSKPSGKKPKTRKGG